jgi:hypothetical protein
MDDSQIIINTKLNVIHKSKESGGELGMDIMTRHLDHLTVRPFTNRRQNSLPRLCQSAPVGERLYVMGFV